MPSLYLLNLTVRLHHHLKHRDLVHIEVYGRIAVLLEEFLYAAHTTVEHVDIAKVLQRLGYDGVSVVVDVSQLSSALLYV